MWENYKKKPQEVKTKTKVRKFGHVLLDVGLLRSYPHDCVLFLKYSQ
jgi:hypothetical protein